METQQPKYRFYATILDTFWGYLNSDTVWEKYWGWSENPPHTPEEFHEQQFQELIDRINRKPFDSEAADKGTAFNEVIDALIENRFTREMWIAEHDDNYLVRYKEQTFSFPISLCREFAFYYKGALTQQRVEAILPTTYGNVLVYGVIDELMPTSVHDIKTTGSYTVGKFKDHHQHLVYLYCLNKNGIPIKDFEYNVVEFGKNGNVVGTYTELYNYNPDTYIPKLISICEEFICFLNDNKDLITDLKIFGKDGK